MIHRKCNNCGQDIFGKDETMLGIQLAAHMDEKHPEDWEEWKDDILEVQESVQKKWNRLKE